MGDETKLVFHTGGPVGPGNLDFLRHGGPVITPPGAITIEVVSVPDDAELRRRAINHVIHGRRPPPGAGASADRWR